MPNDMYNHYEVEEVFNDIESDAAKRGIAIGAAVGTAGLIGAQTFAEARRKKNIANKPVMKKLIEIKHTLLGKKAEETMDPIVEIIEKSAGALATEKAMKGAYKNLNRAQVKDMNSLANLIRDGYDPKSVKTRIFGQLDKERAIADDLSHWKQAGDIDTLIDKFAGAESYSQATDWFEALMDSLSPEETEVIASSVLENMVSKEEKIASYIRDTFDKIASSYSFDEALENYEHLASVVSAEELEVLASELLEKEAVSLRPLYGAVNAAKAIGSNIKASLITAPTTAIRNVGRGVRSSRLQGAINNTIARGETVGKNVYTKARELSTPIAGPTYQNVGQAYNKGLAAWDRKVMNNAVATKPQFSAMPASGVTPGNTVVGSAPEVIDNPSVVSKSTLTKRTYEEDIAAYKADSKHRMEPENWKLFNKNGRKFDTEIPKAPGTPEAPKAPETPPAGDPNSPIMNDVNSAYGKSKEWIKTNPYMATAVAAGAGMMLTNRNQGPYYR